MNLNHNNRHINRDNRHINRDNRPLNRDNKFLISILNRVYQDNNRAILNLSGPGSRESATSNTLLINLNNCNNEIHDILINTLTQSLRNNNIFLPVDDLPDLIDIPTGQLRQPTRTVTVDTNFTSLFQNFLNPIVIHPTQAHIEAATRNMVFSDIINPINTSCPISLERFNNDDNVLIIRHCGHIFNNIGLTSWFASNCRCPVCRYDIRDYSSNINLDNTMNTMNTTNTLPNTEPLNSPRSNLITTLADTFINNYLGNNM
jgi:hypothetical protein